MIYIGNDIAKDTFVLAIPQDNKYKKFKRHTFLNDEAGFKLCESLIDKSGHHIVLEATGTYSMKFTYWFCERGYSLSVINPKSSKYFNLLQGHGNKTDDVDAIALSHYGRSMQPSVFKPQSVTILKIKQQRTIINMFKKNVVQQKNVLHSLEPHPYPDEEAKAILKASIEYLEKRIKEMEKALYDLTAEDYEKQLRLLLTIKGIGRVTAIALIELTNGFKHFDNPKELANFIGIAPAYRQSGTSVRYGGQMTRSGDSTIRGLLYMCSLSAIRWNIPCQDLYNRLKERKKASKIALVAVAHKLVRQAYGVVKNETPFDPNRNTSSKKDSKKKGKTDTE